MEFKHDNINHLCLTQILMPCIDLFSKIILVCYDQLSIILAVIIECFKMYIKIPRYPSFTEVRPRLFCWCCCLIKRLIGVAWWYLFSSASKVICMYIKSRVMGLAGVSAPNCAMDMSSRLNGRQNCRARSVHTLLLIMHTA